jgi:hypothetical protein
MQSVVTFNIHKGDTEDHNVCLNGDFEVKKNWLILDIA